MHKVFDSLLAFLLFNINFFFSWPTSHYVFFFLIFLYLCYQLRSLNFYSLTRGRACAPASKNNFPVILLIPRELFLIINCVFTIERTKNKVNSIIQNVVINRTINYRSFYWTLMYLKTM